MGGGPPRPSVGGPVGDQAKIDIGNFKSALNETVMKVIQRPLGGEDILYNSSLVTMAGGMPLYKATVRINALEAREFEGKPQSLRKTAEQAAAQVALSQLTSNFCNKPGGPLPGPSRSQAAKLPNYKGRLQELLVQEHTKARLFGGLAGECGPVEINYSTQATPSGEGGRPSASRFGSQVDVTTKNFKASFVGEVCKERKTAEQSAAYAALQHFLKQDSMVRLSRRLWLCQHLPLAKSSRARPSRRRKWQSRVLPARPSSTSTHFPRYPGLSPAPVLPLPLLLAGLHLAASWGWLVYPEAMV